MPVLSQRILSHARRALHQLGVPIRLGSETFRFQGYYPSRMATSMEHEPYMLPILRRCLESHSGAFIDVGANVGQTLLKVLSIDRTRRYVGFEPQISCCFAIDKFLSHNGLTNASVYPLALSDRNGMLSFGAEGETDELASFNTEVRAGGSVWFTQARIGDEVLGELGIDSISAIKIDVEGFELDVLNGLLATIRRCRPPVLFEVLPNFSGLDVRKRNREDECEKNSAAADGIFRIFSELGYRIALVDANDGKELPIERFELDDMENFRGINYVAHPLR